MSENKSLVEKVEEFLTNQKQQQSLVQNPFGSNIIYDRDIPDYLLPSQIKGGVESISDNYYRALNKRANKMLRLQIAQARLVKAGDSKFYRDLIKLTNFSRGILSKKPITLENVFEEQIDNLDVLNDLLYTLVHNARYYIDRIGEYRKQTYINLHWCKKHLKKLEDDLQINESLVSDLTKELRENEYSENYILMCAYADELEDSYKNNLHEKELAECRVKLLVNEVPMITELKNFTGKTTDDVEKIVLAIAHQVNSLNETKDAMFIHLKKKELLSIVRSQMDSLAKNTMDIYKRIGVGVQNINYIKNQTRPEYMHVRSIETWRKYSRTLSESAKISNNIFNATKQIKS